MGGRWGSMGSCQWTQTNIYESLCIVLNVIYLFEAIWGLDHLNFTGYDKIHPDFASIGAFLAPSQACEGLLGMPDQYFKVFMFSAKCSLLIPSNLRLK